ncbi:MAG: hypothetical protein E7665_04940 [Ruminococcaceae bacterium]|nr:hypothetical protein [Oscillospiraceae bacterium]
MFRSKASTALFLTIISILSLVGGFVTGSFLISDDSEIAANVSGDAKLIPHRVDSFPAENFKSDVPVYPDILTSNWYGDTEYVKNKLEYAKEKSGSFDPKEIYPIIEDAVIELASYSNYLKYYDSLSIAVGDTVYGAYAAEDVPPIGGGIGYDDIITTGDYIVHSYTELVEASKKAQPGEVIFIPSDVTIDFTMEMPDAENGGFHICLNKGVTLASDRGYVREDGSVSTGGRIVGSGVVPPFTTTKLITCADDSRITGLAFQGPDGLQHVEHHYRAFSVPNPPGSSYFYRYTVVLGIIVDGNNVEIDNCELSGFSYSAVCVYGDDHLFHHNYVHHNQIKGLGYGIQFVGGGGIVEYNLCNFNRHSIAGSGTADTYYIARHNIEMGDFLDHVYDMHGGRDRGDGTNIAGKYVEMYNNTFLSPMNPFHVRGVPVEHYTFFHNILLNPVNQYNYSVITGEKMKTYDNIFGIEKRTVVK